MTIATFLLIAQLLGALGGASVDFIAIRKDIEARGLKPSDLLPTEHLPAVAAELHAKANGIASYSQDFIERMGR
jgi:hypothetical protein